jgi:transcriptional regulator with XRE-family HTH domain
LIEPLRKEEECSAPHTFRECLRQIMQRDGLTQEELSEVTGLAETSVRRIFKAPPESSYLPNLLTAAGTLMLLARRERPKSRRELATWAEQTLSELDTLVELHDEAKPESARRCPTTEHPAISPSRSSEEDQQTALPDWILPDITT